ncbi:MAG: 30S ribosomal protein S20 [Verrucomicrobia bacterium]|nr:30S ribosomal protein S20 [Verrucomicrobiota bacterium]
MANTKSAAKRARQTKRRTLANSQVKSRVKTAKRKLRDLIAEGDQANAATSYRETISAIDRAVKRGVMHKNAAARNKSRLMKAVKGAAAK